MRRQSQARDVQAVSHRAQRKSARISAETFAQLILCNLSDSGRSCYNAGACSPSFPNSDMNAMPLFYGRVSQGCCYSRDSVLKLLTCRDGHPQNTIVVPIAGGDITGYQLSCFYRSSGSNALTSCVYDQLTGAVIKASGSIMQSGTLAAIPTDGSTCPPIRPDFASFCLAA